MHFIHLTKPDGEPTTVNMDMVSEMVDMKSYNNGSRTRIFFNFEIQADYGYTDVIETREDILKKC